MFVNPLIILLSTAAGFAVCRATGLNPHAHDMFLAGGVCLVASVVAMIPFALLRADSKPVDVYQATFFGTAIHLGLSLILGAITVFALATGLAFVWWLLAMFWLTLIAQSVVFVRRMRAPMPPAGMTSN